MFPVLVIPSARYISKELQGIGVIPPLLYPFGSGTLFDYLYDRYDSNVSSIRIVGYEGFSLLNSKLSDYKHVSLIKLDKLSDLAYSVYKGLTPQDEDVVLNFADTFIDDDMPDCPKDCFFYSEGSVSKLWTFFDLNNGHLSKVLDKPDTLNVNNGKLFTGVFRFSHGGYFRECLEESINNPGKGMSSFYTAILMYNSKYQMKPLKTELWYDIGHLDKYFNSKLEVESREFNHISIDKNRGILRKTSEDVDKFIGEIKWYLKLPSEVEYCRPRIFSYSTAYTNPFVEMEYYSYHTVHELFLYGDLRYDQWKSIFERIAFVIHDLSRFTVHDDHIPSSLREMYLDKTVSRIQRISDIPEFQNLINKSIIINNVKYPSLTGVCSVLEGIIPNRLCKLNEFNIIHGDLCFTNILTDSNYSFVKLIDPRGKFGNFDIYGDRRYDLAKLFHSVDGKYDYIIKKKFKVSYDRGHNSIDLSLDDEISSFDLYELLQNVMSDVIGDQKENIELIESLLFLSMVPLHMEDREQQIAMLATGIQILDRVCHIREE